VIPIIQKVWSGYQDIVCLLADKHTIDSVLADTSDTSDETASIKMLERDFDEQNMQRWAPKLIGRYTGTFAVSPAFLPSLEGRLHEDAGYGQFGSPSTWFLTASRTSDGVLRYQNPNKLDQEQGADPINLRDSSSDGEADDSDEAL